MADQFLSGLQGGLGGMGTGASIGAALGTLIPVPGLGTALGAMIGGGIGAMSGSSKAKDQNSALGMLNTIPAVDPNQTMFKDQLYREKKAVDSGFTTDFQVARDIIGKSEAGGMSVAAEMAQSNPALALMMMTQTGQNADNSVNKALGTISTRSMGYTQMIQDLINKMAQRKLDVSTVKAETALGMSAKAMTDFNSNANAGMMKLMDPSVIGGFKGLFSTPGSLLNSGGLNISGMTTDPAALNADATSYENTGVGVPSSLINQ